jgi:hypothetical protein
MSDLKADFTIDLKTAQTYAKKWRDKDSSFDYRGLHGFLIPAENLQKLLDQGPDAIRAYIGVDDDGYAKLMIVGTKWSHPTESHDDMLPDSKFPGRIYDFTRPCPPACGYMSPLNDLP